MARGYDLTTEIGTKEYLRDVEIEYQFQCFDQKEIDGCHRLGEFLESVRKNMQAAAQIYKDNCDKNSYPKSCFKYGQCLQTGNGLPAADDFLALQYLEKSCQLNFGKGCFSAGLIHLRLNSSKEKLSEKTLNFMTRACDLNDSNGCFVLASWYLQGKHLSKDLTKAFEYNQKGCNLDNVACCSNLSLMYKHGHGTERNISLAQEMRTRAVRLSADEAKKQPVLKVNE